MGEMDFWSWAIYTTIGCSIIFLLGGGLNIKKGWKWPWQKF